MSMRGTEVGIRQLHGIRQAPLVNQDRVRSDGFTNVVVEDGDNYVRIGLSESTKVAKLTIVEARFLAQLILEAALRCDVGPPAAPEGDVS